MAFGFFGFKKKPIIEDVEAKMVSSAVKPAPMTFDEALAAQAAAEAAKAQDLLDVLGVQAPAPTAAKPAPVAAEPVVTVPKEAVTDTAPALVVPDAVPAEQDVSVPVEPVDRVEAVEAEQPKVLGQMDTLKATHEDVIAAYKIFLGRLPESMEVVDPRVGVTPAALLVDFLASKEFLDQAPKSQLVLAVAKKILDERKQAAAAEGNAPGAEAAA